MFIKKNYNNDIKIILSCYHELYTKRQYRGILYTKTMKFRKYLPSTNYICMNHFQKRISYFKFTMQFYYDDDNTNQ